MVYSSSDVIDMRNFDKNTFTLEIEIQKCFGIQYTTVCFVHHILISDVPFKGLYTSNMLLVYLAPHIDERLNVVYILFQTSLKGMLKAE